MGRWEPHAVLRAARTGQAAFGPPGTGGRRAAVPRTGAGSRAPGAARRGGARRGCLHGVRDGVRGAQSAAAAGALPAARRLAARSPRLHGGGGRSAAAGGARAGRGAGERPGALEGAGAGRPDTAQLAGYAGPLPAAPAAATRG